MTQEGMEFWDTYRVRRLEINERVKSFDCNDADLNDFICNMAMDYRKAMLAVSYVVENKLENDKVVAFFSLANDRISLNDFDNKTTFNVFRRRRFKNEKRLRSFPAAKVCRLGVDSSSQGTGIGSYLLWFIKSYYIDNNKAGCRFLTVDAYTAAMPFYLKNGFVPLNDDDIGQPTRLLFFDLNDITDYDACGGVR